MHEPCRVRDHVHVHLPRIARYNRRRLHSTFCTERELMMDERNVIIAIAVVGFVFYLIGTSLMVAFLASVH